MTGLPTPNAHPAAVVNFWFGELTPRQWFEGSATLDAEIRQRFGPWVDAALRGHYDAWAETPRGRLALILLLDQFTRNIHRGAAGAFSGDAKAQRLTIEGLAAGMDKQLNLSERQFFYMPLMHAEDSELQGQCLEAFAAFLNEARSIVKFQKEHGAVIDRFGRFPARNAALGRPSTPEEQTFLSKPRRKRRPSPSRARATNETKDNSR